MSNIINLNGTSWSIPAGWTTLNGYGSYEFSGQFQMDENTSALDFDGLYMGYEYDSGLVADIDRISIYIDDSHLYEPEYSNLTPDDAFSILNISNATAEESVSFYDWLIANNATLTAGEPVVPKIPTLTYDLTKLNLSAGTHNISVVAKAEGYKNSAASEAIRHAIAALVSQLSATLPGKGKLAYSTTIGTKAWLFGMTSVLTFDPDTNTVTKVGSISTSLDERAMAAVGTKIYLFGGISSSSNTYGSLNTISVYDIESGSTQTLSVTLPTRAQRVITAVVGTKVYLFGGYHWRDSSLAFDDSYQLNTINVFDTDSNTIQTLSATLPNATMYMSSAVVGTKIYLFGGRNTVGITDLNCIEVFDTETNTIQTLDVTLPTETILLSSAVIGTKIYLFGGIDASDKYLDRIDVFNTENNTIETLAETLPRPMSAVGPAVIGDVIYLFGGVYYSGSDGGSDTIIKVEV